jgi:outer membrane protein assembly factor BamA
MMRSIGQMLAVMVLVAQSSLASVRYEGEPIYSGRELDEILGVVPGTAIDDETLRSRLPRLLTRYVDDGYLDVALTLRSTSEGDHALTIEPGARVRLGRRLTTGVPRELLDELDERATLTPGDPFSVEGLERDLTRATERLVEGGYAFAETHVSDLTREGDAVSYRLAVVPGERVMVDSLHVEGLGVTRPATAARIAGFVPGRTFRESERRAVRERLVRSGLFVRVGEVRLRTLPDGGGAYTVDVEEAPSTLITGVVGVGGADQELTGLLDVTLANLFGTARSFRALWEGRGSGRVYYEIAYREPWILGLPAAISGQFRQDQEDTLYTRTDWLADVEYSVLDNLVLRAGWQSEESTTPLALLERTTRASTRFGLRWDGRDDAFAPRRGGLIDATGTRGTQKERFAEGPRIEREVTTLEAHTEVHVPIGVATGLFAGTTGYVRQARGESLRPENLYPLGGVSTIRGYEERRFRTGLGTAVTVELRRYLASASAARVHGFVDAAYMDPARTLGTGGDAWKLGIGVGVRVPSRVGLLGVDLGAADEIGSFAEARVHLSVVGRY